MRARIAAASVVLCAWASAQDYPGVARWYPAHADNQTSSSRPTSYPIQYVVIHTVQGSYLGALSWFANPASRVSCHYTLRSADGEVAQSVLEKNIGWHAGNWWYNCRSVGIEHEGWVDDPRWYTTPMYLSSADLTRYLIRKYGMTVSRASVIGHVEVPNQSHYDPGVHWDWERYMFLVRCSAKVEWVQAPTTLIPGERGEVVIRFRNDGFNTWPASGDGSVSLGTQDPQDRTSPLATPDWPAPNRPARIERQVWLGESYEARFPIRAPKTPGTYRESFQLLRDDRDGFGPVVTLLFAVSDQAAVVDNTDARFATQGTWSTGTTAPGRYGNDYRYAATSPTSTAAATWRLEPDQPGTYDVYVWWSQGTNRATDARYTLHGSRPWDVQRRVFNQQTGGGQWNFLGSVALAPGTGAVTLHARGSRTDRVVIADAVRIVRRQTVPLASPLMANLPQDLADALRFMESLDDAQFARAVHRVPLEYGALRPDQQRLFASLRGRSHGLDKESFFLDQRLEQFVADRVESAELRLPAWEAGPLAPMDRLLHLGFCFGRRAGDATEARVTLRLDDPRFAVFLNRREEALRSRPVTIWGMPSCALDPPGAHGLPKSQS